MTKVAILIDGGFLLKRLPRVHPGIDCANAEAVGAQIDVLVRNHLKYLSKRFGVGKPYALLYRCFYYDAHPYGKKEQTPIGKKAINYANSNAARFRRDLFDQLKKKPSFALRLGEVRRGESWILKAQAQKKLLERTLAVDQLTDSDFKVDLRQKAVDMRFALDIASITFKKQAQTLVLVTGDSDFTPAAKLARREGMRVILDPLWQSISKDLFEHIDGLTSGFPRPGEGGAPGEASSNANDASE